MNDLLERYLGAVCSYFYGWKKKEVYNDLKQHIQASASHYDALEDLLVHYGHPRSIALSYGYRPFISHIYNRKKVSLIEKVVFIVSGIYLVLSTLYYLSELNCLPFLYDYITLPILNWGLSFPFVVMSSIGLISYIILIFLDRKDPVKQEHDVNWSLKKLYDLPHQSQYPSHTAESILMFIFIFFFLIYTLFFSSDIILQVQHDSYQMIHLMTYFFQPFVMMILIDYIIDMTKKLYTKKYIKYSLAVHLFTLSSLTLFVINSHFLSDYLLPMDMNMNYTLVNIFIIGALLMIYSLSLYKLVRNIKSYRSLFRK